MKAILKAIKNKLNIDFVFIEIRLTFKEWKWFSKHQSILTLKKIIL